MSLSSLNVLSIDPGSELGANLAENKKLWRKFVLLLLCLFWGSVQATEVKLESSQVKWVIDKGVSYFVDEQELTAEQVNSLPRSVWTSLDGIANFGYTKKVHWFSFELRNYNSAEQGRYLLDINYPQLDRVEVFLYHSGVLVNNTLTGDSFPFSQRSLPHRNLLVPLDLADGALSQVYVRVQTSGVLQLPMVIWSQHEYYQQDSLWIFIDAMFYGAVLIMAAFNLFLYFSLKETVYLYFVFFVFFVVVLLFTMEGYTAQYVFPEFPPVNGMVFLLALPLLQIFTSLFSIQYLNLYSRYPALYKLLMGFVAFGWLCVFGAFILPYEIQIRILAFVVLPLSLANLISGLICWTQGDARARLFSLAWFAFLFASLAAVLSRMGIIEPSFLTEKGLIVSVTAQISLFSMALASRFQSEKDSRFKAQQKALKEVCLRREAETRLLHRGSHHEVTGLPNRLTFEQALDRSIKNSNHHNKTTAAVLLYVRRFGEVNKTLGHRNADVLLGLLALRINHVLQAAPDILLLEENDDNPIYAAHVEGVSFCFTLSRASEEILLADVKELVAQMARPIEFMDLSLGLNLKVGCSFIDDPADDAQTLLRKTFIACDQVGPDLSNIAVYQSKMNPYSHRRLTLMTELREALEYDRLELYFQPQVHLASNTVVGFEALLRWIHHEFGFVPPDEFIPMAEQAGLMPTLTKWVLRKAVLFCKELQSRSYHMNVAVNISALNLREFGFCDFVCELLRQENISPQSLVLEITETAAMIDPEGAMSVLSQLCDANIRLSIDDFGTGHSSLAYLRKLPVHEIKIDRSFIGEMDTVHGDQTIVRTTIRMCQDLGFEVVAEGVENNSTINILQEMACDLAQGYHIARPMNKKDTMAWLESKAWQVAKEPVLERLRAAQAQQSSL